MRSVKDQTLNVIGTCAVLPFPFVPIYFQHVFLFFYITHDSAINNLGKKKKAKHLFRNIKVSAEMRADFVGLFSVLISWSLPTDRIKELCGVNTYGFAKQTCQ